MALNDTIYRAGEAPDPGQAYTVTKTDAVTGAILEGDAALVRIVSEREALGRYLGAFEQSAHRDHLIATLKSGRALRVAGWRVEYAGWQNVAELKRGDVLTLRSGHRRIVVRVIDATGAIGGLVDTTAMDGRYSRSAGFVAGKDIASVEPGAGLGRLGALGAQAAGWPRGENADEARFS